MSYKKTAKDKAFDAKYQRLRSEMSKWITLCSQKEQVIQKQKEEIADLTKKIADLESAISYVSENKYTADQLVHHMERTSAINGLLKVWHNNTKFFE